MTKITDEYVLSKDTITTHEAADYLGISWWNLVDGLRKGTYKFGTAKLNHSGKYTYTVYAEQVYKFKHGTYDVDQQQFSDLCCQLSEAVRLMKSCVEMMSNLFMKKENQF